METVPEEYRVALGTAIAEVADLIRPVVDFTVPGLGAWDLRGLSGHFLRAIRTPLSYLAAPEPEGPALPGAAHYAAAYLDRRDRDGATLDQSIAVRGAAELGQDSRHPSEPIVEEAGRLDAALATTPADRRIGTLFGPLRLGDYLRTRTLEIVVHGTDIARAVGRTWSPPDILVADVLSLLSEISVVRGTAIDVLCALTGRPHPNDVLPILR